MFRFLENIVFLAMMAYLVFWVLLAFLIVAGVGLIIVLALAS